MASSLCHCTQYEITTFPHFTPTPKQPTYSNSPCYRKCVPASDHGRNRHHGQQLQQHLASRSGKTLTKICGCHLSVTKPLGLASYTNGRDHSTVSWNVNVDASLPEFRMSALLQVIKTMGAADGIFLQEVSRERLQHCLKNPGYSKIGTQAMPMPPPFKIKSSSALPWCPSSG
jgi:hypothetical protein